MGRGVRRNADDYLGIIDEIFGMFEQAHEDCNLDLQSFEPESKELEALQ